MNKHFNYTEHFANVKEFHPELYDIEVQIHREHQNLSIKCECGTSLKRGNLSRHLKSNSHRDYKKALITKALSQKPSVCAK